MQLNDNRLNTAHGIISCLIGFTYPAIYFLSLFFFNRLYPNESIRLFTMAACIVIVWNFIVMIASKINPEFERNLKIIEYHSFAYVRRPGQEVDWKEAIVKYEKGEMDAFLEKFFKIKVSLCLGLLFMSFLL